MRMLRFFKPRKRKSTLNVKSKYRINLYKNGKRMKSYYAKTLKKARDVKSMMEYTYGYKASISKRSFFTGKFKVVR